MFTTGNVTGTRMLMGIGIVKAFIMAGKLKTKGNLPLEQLLDENAQAGGDLNALFKALGRASGAAGQCGLDFDLEDKDLTDMFGADEFPPIAELPAGRIEVILSYKTTAKKKSGELSLVLKVGLTDEQDEPEIILSLNLTGQHIQKIVPLLKSQFLAQNRISELVGRFALTALVKASGLKKPSNENFAERLAYRSMIQSAEKQISQETKEVIWLYAEQTFAGLTSATTQKGPDFSIIVGIHISDKLTLSVDFTKKTKKSKV